MLFYLSTSPLYVHIKIYILQLSCADRCGEWTQTHLPCNDGAYPLIYSALEIAVISQIDHCESWDYVGFLKNWVRKEFKI